jgi:hypothetical protein
MKIDFLLIGAYGEGGHLPAAKFLKAFERQGYTAAIAAYSPQTHDILIREGCRSFDFSALGSRLCPGRIDDSLIQHYERKYDLTSLRDFCWVESQYYFVKPERLFQRAIRSLIATERFFEEHEVGCCFSPLGKEIGQNCAYVVGRSQGVPSIEIGAFPPHFKDRSQLHTDPLRKLEDFHPIAYSEMTADERRFIADACDSLRQKRAIASYGSSDIVMPESGRLGMLRYYFERKDWHRLGLKLRYAFEKYGLSPVRRRISSIFQSKFDPSRPYVFFPLHLHNDSQITAINPQFFRQEWIVDYVAQSLPQGVQLYVKGHPGCMPLPISALRAMSKHDNVTVIDPETNPHSVIQGARAVVVINSTVGFEALAYGKPVVVLGDWTMKGLGITFDVENLADLARTIRNAVDAGSVDEQKVHAVFYSLWRSMYDGHYFRSNPDYDALARSIALKAKSLTASPACQGKSIAAAGR